MLTDLEKLMKDALMTASDSIEQSICRNLDFCERKSCQGCPLVLEKDKINYAIAKATAKENQKKKGVFITFEGPEGAGKSSVCDMISKRFDNILLVREPGATQIGEKVREMVHHDEMPDISELLLFEAARACLVQTVIKPALDAGKTVICDRFYDSTTAYQGYGRGIDLGTIKFLNKLASEITPELTILFDIDPVVGMKRKGKPTDRIESAGMDFHNRVRNGYLQIAKDNAERFVVINAEQEQDVVARNVFDSIEHYCR